MPPFPLAKIVMAILAPGSLLAQETRTRLEISFGPIDYVGKAQPFDTTDYYASEMGTGLTRRFISFRGLHSPEFLARWKAVAVALEMRWAQDGKRTVNLDVGYLDADKLVLASYKKGPCKLYIGDGVYADILLKYAKGGFEPLPWAFTDFKDARYVHDLLVIREKMKAEFRRLPHENT